MKSFVDGKVDEDDSFFKDFPGAQDFSFRTLESSPNIWGIN